MSSRYRRVMIESDSEDEVEFNRGFEENGLLPSEEEHASLLVKRVATAVMLTDGDQLLAPTQTEFELDIGKLKKVYSLIVNDTTLRPFLFPELYQPAVVTMELAEVDLVHTNLNDSEFSNHHYFGRRRGYFLLHTCLVKDGEWHRRLDCLTCMRCKVASKTDKSL